MKIKPHKCSSSHNVNSRGKSPRISELIHYSVTKKCKSVSPPDSNKGSNSSSSSKKSLKSSRKSSLTKSSKKILNLLGHTSTSKTLYVLLKNSYVSWARALYMCPGNYFLLSMYQLVHNEF